METWSSSTIIGSQAGFAASKNIFPSLLKKYFKVVRETFDTFRARNEWRDTTVHAFVDRVTGEVYKPAGWKAPAKHVRFDMRIIEHREFLHNPKNVGWAGGYLYLR